MPSDRAQRRIDRLLDDAEQAADRKDWLAVAELAGEARALDDANVEALELLTLAARMQSDAPSELTTELTAGAGTQPSSFANGRYVVARFLGEGGKKKVYLAHDGLLDRDVAFALIKSDGLDQIGRERISREAQAMGRLGSHPHVVTVFDLGETEGQPFMVTELMGGGDVERLIEKAAGPLSVEQSIEIAKSVCRGLEFAHGKGIVHRDLKPGNVWLTADGVAKIGDYGLAVALDRSRLTVHGMMVGTVSYMPPEQALGGEVTPRSDLYSLGAMLYEMVTGRPPFTGSDSTAIISQHINTPPVAPSWVTEHCPPSLEAIILSLLRKVPIERPASASEVLAALEKVDSTQKSASHSDSNILDRLAKGVFVGREKELERLRKAFDEAFAGHGGLVMLVGEPGIGKTRTTQELETYARMRGATVLWGTTNESAGAPPYWPWLQIGRQWVAGGGVVEDLRLPPETIGELSRIFPPLRQQPNFLEPQPESDPQSVQFRLFDAYAAFLGAVAGQGPLVVVLDDLHWADKSSLLMLQHLARANGRSRTLIVGNYRDTDITRQSALSESLAALNRESGFERVVLRGLSRDEVADYIRAKAHVEPRRAVLDRIYEETEGNAFFLSEVVNLMAEEGTLEKESVSDIAIPDGVREALGRRLNRLSPETNELLQVATIIGREFSYETLAATGGRDENELFKLIEEALEARVIEELDRPGRYRFTHAQMQETLLAELSTTRRVRLHGQVGEALETLAGARAEERAAQLARHFVEAATLAPKFLEKALSYSAAAARQAVGQAAHADAVDHFKNAMSVLEGTPGDSRGPRLLADLGRSEVAVADYRAAWQHLRAAFESGLESRDIELVADLSELIGLTWFTRIPEQVQLLQRGLGAVPSGGRPEFQLRLAIGVASGMRGDLATALDSFAIARRLLDAHPSARDERRLLRSESSVRLFHLQLEETTPMFERLARDDGLSPSEASGVNFMLGGIYVFRGQLDAALIAAQRSLALAEGTGQSGMIAGPLYQRAGIEMLQGHWELAGITLDRGDAVVGRDQRIIFDHALLHLLRGDFAEARDSLASLQALCAPGAASHSEANLVVISALLGAWAPSQDPEVKADAMATARTFAAGFAQGSPNPLFLLTAASGIGLLACETHDEGLAEVARAAIALFPDGFNASWIFHGSHTLGLLSLEFGDIAEAIADFERALEFMTQADDCPVPNALCAFDTARAYRTRGQPGDEERASKLTDEALEIAQRLGMKPLIAKIISMREILKA